MRRGGFSLAIGSIMASMAGAAHSMGMLGSAFSRIGLTSAAPIPDKARQKQRARVRKTRVSIGRSAYMPHSGRREAARHAARGARGFVDWQPRPSGPGMDVDPVGREPRRAARRDQQLAMYLAAQRAGSPNRQGIRETELFFRRHWRKKDL